MKRLDVVWTRGPSDEDEGFQHRYIIVEIREPWLAVDGDQLILPVYLVERDGAELTDQEPALLKQYGGESLLNDMLLADADLEVGSRWEIGHEEERGRYAGPIPSDD